MLSAPHTQCADPAQAPGADRAHRALTPEHKPPEYNDALCDDDSSHTPNRHAGGARLPDEDIPTPGSVRNDPYERTAGRTRRSGSGKHERDRDRNVELVIQRRTLDDTISTLRAEITKARAELNVLLCRRDLVQKALDVIHSKESTRMLRMQAFNVYVGRCAQYCTGVTRALRGAGFPPAPTSTPPLHLWKRTLTIFLAERLHLFTVLHDPSDAVFDLTTPLASQHGCCTEWDGLADTCRCGKTRVEWPPTACLHLDSVERKDIYDFPHIVHAGSAPDTRGGLDCPHEPDGRDGPNLPDGPDRTIAATDPRATIEVVDQHIYLRASAPALDAARKHVRIWQLEAQYCVYLARARQTAAQASVPAVHGRARAGGSSSPETPQATGMTAATWTHAYVVVVCVGRGTRKNIRPRVPTTQSHVFTIPVPSIRDAVHRVWHVMQTIRDGDFFATHRDPRTASVQGTSEAHNGAETTIEGTPIHDLC